MARTDCDLTSRRHEELFPLLSNQRLEGCGLLKVFTMTGGGFAVLDTGSTSNDANRFSGVSYIRGPSWLHMPALTIGLLGISIVWSVEMAYASPYLLSLGLSKSAMAVVFVAGPLSGLVMQPVIGILTDSNTSKWGRRRPYMIIGTILCVFAMSLLGWTKEVAGFFTSEVCGERKAR